MSKPITAAEPAEAQAPAEPVRTPENTPLPGGGRWVWDDSIANWAKAPAQE